MSSFQELLNYFFIKFGNKFDDMLDMNYWRFRSILKSNNKITCLENGKPYIEEGPLPESSKDMIKRRIAQR